MQALSLSRPRPAADAGSKGPPSAPPAIPPIIISPFGRALPRQSSIDPLRSPMPPPLRPPRGPDLRAACA